MKNLITCFMTALSVTALAQEHKAELLKEPANWEFERFTLPPQFAPGISYKGAEELRFAPGMFNKDSASYFTYIFVAQLNDVTAVSETDIRDYLLNYYRGLCSITAKDRSLVIDTTQITAKVERKKDTPADETIYNALVNLFGVFVDGAPLKLSLEVKVVMDVASKRTYLVFIASPREKTDNVWKTLYRIQKEFMIPASTASKTFPGNTIKCVLR